MVFAKDFVGSRKYPEKSADVVERAFSVHLSQLIKTYNSQKRTEPDEIQAARDRERTAAQENRRRKVGTLAVKTLFFLVHSAHLYSYTNDAVRLA